MKKTLLLVSFGTIIFVACKQKSIDKAHFVGTYKLTDMHNPMYENDYAARKKMIDTSTVLDIGRISYWQTNNLDSVKMLELNMLNEERNMMMSTFKKMGIVVMNDSVFVRTSPGMTDTCYYKFVNNDQLIYRSSNFSKGRLDTIIVDRLNEKEVVLKEKFLNTHITTTYSK